MTIYVFKYAGSDKAPKAPKEDTHFHAETLEKAERNFDYWHGQKAFKKGKYAFNPAKASFKLDYIIEDSSIDI